MRYTYSSRKIKRIGVLNKRIYVTYYLSAVKPSLFVFIRSAIPKERLHGASSRQHNK